MGRLDGKVAVVTGGARGLGAEDARFLANEGAKVVIVDIRDSEGEALAASIAGETIYRRLDVCDEKAWQNLIAEIEQRFDRLDVLVNNAGIVTFGDPETIEIADYRRIMDVSMAGTVLGCKHAIPLMKRGNGGSIINMASIASIQGEPYAAAYCAAKGGVEAYTRAVAVYCAQNRIPIRCNSLHPAAIDTPMVRSAATLAEAAGMNALLDDNRASLANPLGEAADVANLVVFLASDESKFISGQKFVIDNTSSITPGQIPGDTSISINAKKW
jgi:3(or 17)beta-hydroxysteroid dehydrogenase